MIANSNAYRRRIAILTGIHLAATVAAAAAFSFAFGHNARAVASHIVLVTEWDLTLLAVLSALLAVSPSARWPLVLYQMLVVATGTVQVHLYALNGISNVSWGRNINAHLVAAFAPTVWSGREPFPVAAPGIILFVCAAVTFSALPVVWWCRGMLAGADALACEKGNAGAEAPAHVPKSASAPAHVPTSARAQAYGRALLMACAPIMAGVFAATLFEGIAARDSLFWKQELLASFFRPEGFAFEPTARRAAAVERDALVRALYPRPVATARRKHVVLVIVDSLRADRMHVYGYRRPTTPFLSRLVQSGRMKKVQAAFSTCSESLCGITSTLSGREFRDISARTYQLQDVLRDAGYQTWFLLSGNHTGWNGLPSFYRADEGTLFDGTQTSRYSMDDDRLVLEGLERIPPASADHPAFFYVHLMSTHYLGVQFAGSHVFTRADDEVSPGLEPYKILPLLNKPDRYDDKVRQADDIIRQLFEALKAKHYLDDAMVVVTSDHGEGLGERHWAHGWNLYEEDIRIPMLFYDEPPTRYPDLSFAAQVDIAPTIVDRLGLPVPASWAGESLVKPSRTRFTYHQTYFAPNRFAVVYRNRESLFKFIATPQYGKEELYDLMRDRREAQNLVTEQPEMAELLRKKIQAYRTDEP